MPQHISLGAKTENLQTKYLTCTWFFYFYAPMMHVHAVLKSVVKDDTFLKYFLWWVLVMDSTEKSRNRKHLDLSLFFLHLYIIWHDTGCDSSRNIPMFAMRPRFKGTRMNFGFQWLTLPRMAKYQILGHFAFFPNQFTIGSVYINICLAFENEENGKGEAWFKS